MLNARRMYNNLMLSYNPSCVVRDRADSEFLSGVELLHCENYIGGEVCSKYLMSGCVLL